jgi:hypothetical protein
MVFALFARGGARMEELKGKKFPNPQVEEIPTTGGYTEYSSAPWWKHGDRYQVPTLPTPVSPEQRHTVRCAAGAATACLRVRQLPAVLIHGACRT